MRNVGEPIELRLVQDGKKISIPGFIMNLSAGGMGIVVLGNYGHVLHLGNSFDLDLKLPKLSSHHVECKLMRVAQAKHAVMHHSDQEWWVGLKFTKIKSSVSEHINRMAEDWSICETKIQMKLPDICFRQCEYWDICEKPVKIQTKSE